MKGKLYWLLFKQSIKETAEYKMTFFLIIFFGLAFTTIEILSTIIFFDSTDLIMGWNIWEFFLLIISYSLIQYIYQFLFTASHETLSDKIIDGNLDYSLIRPVNSYLFSIFYRIDVPSLVNVLVVLFFGVLIFIKLNFSILMLLFYILFIILGVWFYFVICQIAVSLTFWFERADVILGVPEYLIDASNRPRSVYPKIIQILLTYILPTLTATNSPVEVIRGSLDWISLLYYLIFVVLATVLSLLLWNKGIKKYVSTS